MTMQRQEHLKASQREVSNVAEKVSNVSTPAK